MHTLGRQTPVGGGSKKKPRKHDAPQADRVDEMQQRHEMFADRLTQRGVQQGWKHRARSAVSAAVQVRGPQCTAVSEGCHLRGYLHHVQCADVVDMGCVAEVRKCIPPAPVTKTHVRKL